jgi:hypothetical protein
MVLVDRTHTTKDHAIFLHLSAPMVGWVRSKDFQLAPKKMQAKSTRQKLLHDRLDRLNATPPRMTLPSDATVAVDQPRPDRKHSVARSTKAAEEGDEDELSSVPPPPNADVMNATFVALGVKSVKHKVVPPSPIALS